MTTTDSTGTHQAIEAKTRDDVAYLPADVALRRGVVVTLREPAGRLRRYGPWLAWCLVPIIGLAISPMALGVALGVESLAMFWWLKLRGKPLGWSKLRIDERGLTVQEANGESLLPWSALKSGAFDASGAFLVLAADGAVRQVTTGVVRHPLGAGAPPSTADRLPMPWPKTHPLDSELRALVRSGRKRFGKQPDLLGLCDWRERTSAPVSRAFRVGEARLGARHNLRYYGLRGAVQAYFYPSHSLLTLWPYRRPAGVEPVAAKALPAVIRWAVDRAIRELGASSMTEVDHAIWHLPDATRGVFHTIISDAAGREIVHLETFCLSEGNGRFLAEVSAEVCSRDADGKWLVTTDSRWFQACPDWEFAHVGRVGLAVLLARHRRRVASHELVALEPRVALQELLQAREDFLLSRGVIAPARTRTAAAA